MNNKSIMVWQVTPCYVKWYIEGSVCKVAEEVLGNERKVSFETTCISKKNSLP